MPIEYDLRRVARVGSAADPGLVRHRYRLKGTSVLDVWELTGRSDSHVVALEGTTVRVHRDVVAPFRALQRAATLHGIVVDPLSGFRDIGRQVRIWNEKASGRRPLLDRCGKRLDPDELPEDALVEAILTWSALPGLSRHHWGSDLDVRDATATGSGPGSDLVSEHYSYGGRFAVLSEWMDHDLPKFGFFRPYDLDRGGVAPEPWHISFAEVAEPCTQALTLELVAEVMDHVDLTGIAYVRRQLPAIIERYGTRVAAFRASGTPT